MKQIIKSVAGVFVLLCTVAIAVATAIGAKLKAPLLAAKALAVALLTWVLEPLYLYAERHLCLWVVQQSGFITNTNPQPIPVGSDVVSVRAEFALPVTLAANDVLAAMYLPAGCVPVDWAIDSDDLDSNVGPTLTMDVGILNAAGTAVSVDAADGGAKWAAAATIGQSAGVTRPTTVATFRTAVSNDANRKVGVVIAAAAATKAAGTLGVTLWYRAAYQGK